MITRKGGKVVTIPLAPRTARAIDLATGERTEGPLFLAADGKRLDRHGAARIVRRVTRRAGIAKHVGPHTLRHAFIICTAISARGTTKSEVGRFVPDKYLTLHEARAARSGPGFLPRCAFQPYVPYVTHSWVSPLTRQFSKSSTDNQGHSSPRRRRPAPRRAGGCIARRPAHHHALRPGAHQPGPARHVHRRHLHRRGSPLARPRSILGRPRLPWRWPGRPRIRARSRSHHQKWSSATIVNRRSGRFGQAAQAVRRPHITGSSVKWQAAVVRVSSA